MSGSCFERDPRPHLWNFSKHAIDRRDDFFEPGFFAGAEVGTGMQNQKRQLELIGTRQLFGQGANRVRMKLRIRGREIDQIICVGKDRQ